MKIKIIKNAPCSMGASNIGKYIGQIFEVETLHDNGNIGVDFDEGIGAITVYKGEYEIIEDIQKEIKDFVNQYYKWGIGAEETIEFILENRVALVGLLQ